MHCFRLLIIIALLSLSFACASPARQSSVVRAASHRIDRPLNQGAELYQQGCYGHALEYFLEAHERSTAADDLPGIAGSLNSIANVYFQLDDAQSALRVYAEALGAYRQLNDPDGTVRVLANQAAALVRSGELDEADRKLDQADAVAGPTQRLRVLRLKNRALLAMARSDRESAETMLGEALAAAGSYDRPVKAAAHYAFGRLLIDAGRPQEAESHLRAALDIDRALGAYPAMAKDLAALGACYAQLGDHAAAVNSYQRSAKIFALIQDTVRTQALIAPLQRSAAEAGIDIEASLHWIDQWLAGQTEASPCR
jgi:tetratricopeptide (TPR) repeat protein